MAEILSNQYQQKAGVPKAKKTSVRVDLTPMVDLGFLLISFFIFTTTLSQPTVMKLAIPDDKENRDPSEVPVNKTLNLILGDNNQAYVFSGCSETAFFQNAMASKKLMHQKGSRKNIFLVF